MKIYFLGKSKLLEVRNVINMNKYLLWIFFFVFFSHYSFSEIRSLKNNKVNVRLGPSKNYPIKFIYKNKYLPVSVIDEHYNWRKIKDYENDAGWVHISQLSRTKTTITIRKNGVIFSSPTIYSKPIARLEIHNILIIKKCNEYWCKVKNPKTIGWIKKKYLWGIKNKK